MFQTLRFHHWTQCRFPHNTQSIQSRCSKEEDDHLAVATKPHHHRLLTPPSPATASAWIWGRMSRWRWRAGLLRRSCWCLLLSALSASPFLTHSLSILAGWAEIIWSSEKSKARHIKAIRLFWSQVGHHVCGCCWRSLSGKCPVCLTDYSRWHQCGHWTHSIGRAFGHIGVYRNWFWTTKELHHSHDSPDRLRGVS